VRKYGYLLKDADYPGQDFGERLNKDSVEVFNGYAEKYLQSAPEGEVFQLLRTGYYKKSVENGKLVLSETVSLKDGFKK